MHCRQFDTEQGRSASNPIAEQINSSYNQSTVANLDTIDDTIDNVNCYACQCQSGCKGEPTLLIIERVAWLRSAELFADTPDYVLASIAQVLEPVNVLPEATFITQGDPGDCMYIIVDGSVRVHVDGRTIDTLGAGETVGEFAILDPEPRSASVTANEDTFLYRLDKAAFDEAMADRPEIAASMIRVLVRRLRARTTTAPSANQALLS